MMSPWIWGCHADDIQSAGVGGCKGSTKRTEEGEDVVGSDRQSDRRTNTRVGDRET